MCVFMRERKKEIERERVCVLEREREREREREKSDPNQTFAKFYDEKLTATFCCQFWPNFFSFNSRNGLFMFFKLFFGSLYLPVNFFTLMYVVTGPIISDTIVTFILPIFFCKATETLQKDFLQMNFSVSSEWKKQTLQDLENNKAL